MEQKINPSQEMAWLSNRTIEYHHTVSNKQSVSQLVGHSLQWEKISKARGNTNLYEQIRLANADITKDHVLIYPTTTLVEDCQIPRIVEKASNWDSLTKDVPGFTIAMHRVAELMNKTGWYLTNTLNDLLQAEGLGMVNNVGEVISKATDKFTPKKQKEVLKTVLKVLFQPFVDQEQTGSLAMTEWHNCLSCLNKRNAICHPLGLYSKHIDVSNLNELRVDIEENVDYQNMRHAALVMVKVGEKMLVDGNAW